MPNAFHGAYAHCVHLHERSFALAHPDSLQPGIRHQKLEQIVSTFTPVGPSICIVMYKYNNGIGHGAKYHQGGRLELSAQSARYLRLGAVGS